MDRATRNLLEKNDKIGEELQASMDTALKHVQLYVNVELPQECSDNGRAIQDSAQKIQIDMSKIASGLFKPGEVPAYAFVSNIDVKNGVQTNGEGRRISFSALTSGCGRVASSAHNDFGADGEEFTDGGTFLIMGDGVPVPEMQGVYDASSFTDKDSIFTRYSSALERDYEENLSEIKETGAVMYTSTFNDTEVIEVVDGEEGAMVDKASSPKYDFFLGLISKNRDELSQPPTLHKRPGKTHKHVYTIDIAAEDLSALQESAYECIFQPLETHLISLKKDSNKNLNSTFDILARSESRKVDGEDVKWADSTNLNLTLGITLSYFANVRRI